ncbi:MAG: hypothetical protein QG589_195 [Patescibacteria group bacterium]|nr:hypothetical protein [Patescibacteria group bacterium]
MNHRLLHYVSLCIGLLFLIPSLISAFIFHYPHFYTAFAFGTWLLLDFIDWKINNTSILGYFFTHTHRDAFALFFILASTFCFIVDYLYGVRLSGMWRWTDYKTIHFIRMYVFMNTSYILGMYELFRIIQSVCKKIFAGYNPKPVQFSKHFYTTLVFIGVLFLLLPLYTVVYNTRIFIEYVMLAPFIGMVFVADGTTGIWGGKPFIEYIFGGNILYIVSIIMTALIGATITEYINIFGGEWSYVRMPFPNITLYNIPVAVFVGWIPLVFGSIALVHLIKRSDYVWDKKDFRKTLDAN